MSERGLHVRLSQAAPVPLDVELSCAPGEVLGIFGPSGSGKTTILRAIAGLHTPEAGRVTVGGEVWLDTAAGRVVPVHERAIGFVFQEYALFPHLTALGNVLVALGHRPREARRRRAGELLDLVRLADVRHRRPGALSGGERQRVALARALARDPAVLLLDEPFAAMDRVVRRRLQDEVDVLRRLLDIPLVIVTHDFDDIVRLATHLLVLRAGHTVAAGPLQDVTSRPDVGWLGETVGAGVVIDAVVARTHDARGLAELTFDGGTLVAPDQALAAGAQVRVRVPAREVILAASPPERVSLHNVLEGVVAAVAPDARGTVAVVQVAVGPTRILAEVTRDAVERLGIAEGCIVYALVKSVSLEVLASGAG